MQRLPAVIGSVRRANLASQSQGKKFNHLSSTNYQRIVRLNGSRAVLVAARRFASAANQNGGSPAQGGAPKPPLGERIKQVLIHTWHYLRDGSIQFGQNFTATRKVLLQSWRSGTPLTRRERQLVVKTAADLFRLVPFAVIVIVPFAELALPILLKLFPNMLPSTFTTQSQKANNARRQLEAKLEVVKFLQETQSALSSKVKFDSEEDKKQYEALLATIKRGDTVPIEQLKKYADALDEEFDLSQLEWRQLRALCRYFNIPSIGTRFLLIEALKLKLNALERDDEAIVREGLGSLTLTELADAARERGMRTGDRPISEVPKEELLAFMRDWLELSAAEIPMYLHLVLRAVDHDGLLADVHQTPAPAVVDQVKLLVPELVEVKVASSNTLAKDSVTTGLSKKIQSMLHELETEIGVKPTAAVGHASSTAPAELSAAALACIKTVFDTFDVDHNKLITPAELVQGLHVLGFHPPSEEITKIFQELDSDHSGGLTFEEFTRCLQIVQRKFGH